MTSTANAQKCIYLDNGTFVSPRSVVHYAAQILVDQTPAFGLMINPQKLPCMGFSAHHSRDLELYLESTSGGIRGLRKSWILGFTYQHCVSLTIVGEQIWIHRSVSEICVFCAAASVEPAAQKTHINKIPAC